MGMHWPFQQNREYSRGADIHKPFGGQEQNGICTPKSVPGIFLFTGATGVTHGYRDSFQPDGSFRYTGEGRYGDMVMKVGNKAIRDHALNGKDLLVFEILGKRKPVRFINTFSCAGWEIERQPDTIGAMRDAIVFTLMPLESIAAQTDPPMVAKEEPAEADLTSLRYRALAAANPAVQESGSASRTIFQRSEDVRRYVLARAGGTCEACRSPAPFTNTSGRPYLEAHHIRRLTDGGPDHPTYVAGICPNCHRRAHYSADRAAFNKALGDAVVVFERNFLP